MHNCIKMYNKKYIFQWYVPLMLCFAVLSILNIYLSMSIEDSKYVCIYNHVLGVNFCVKVSIWVLSCLLGCLAVLADKV